MKYAQSNPLISNLSEFSLPSILKISTIMKTLFILLLVVIIGTGTSTFSQAVSIGTQEWMTMNLDVSTFRNGDPIPEAQTINQWKKAGKKGKPAWCNYNNDQKNGAKYGKLYNWYALSDPRGLAPIGYHIPSYVEWKILVEYLGGGNVADNKIKSSSDWYNNYNGNNSTGFSGLPGGYCDDYGAFGYEHLYGYWWSSTEENIKIAKCFYLAHERGKGDRGDALHKAKGVSVRCLRD